tara:strand:- start:1822 stop:2979 length:1158 start_codon:yes stop_codon:yes gene_type:complete
MNKEFKTLSEIYLTGKPQEPIKEEKKIFTSMSSLYKEVLLKEAEEDMSYTISAQDEVGDVEILGTVSQDVKSEIQRDVYRHAKELNKKFNTLLDISGFQFKEFNNYLFGIIKKYDVDADKFESFMSGKSEQADRKLSDILTGPYGELNIEDVMMPLIDRFGIIARSGDEHVNFYRELVQGSFKIQGTNVGDGEFMLAMLTDAKKAPGEGDVTSGGIAYEVGTQEKTLPGPWSKGRSGKASRGDERKGSISYLGMNDGIANVVGLKEKDPKQALEFITNTLKDAFSKHYNDSHIKTHAQMIFDDPNLSKSIVGCYALNYYMLEHNDDYIVIMNYGRSIAAKKYNRAPGFTKYMYAKDWNTCFENMVSNQNFIVTVDGVNITRILIR